MIIKLVWKGVPPTLVKMEDIAFRVISIVTQAIRSYLASLVAAVVVVLEISF